MKRVLISVTNDLVTDQRVHKVAMSLTKAGYSITLVGRKLAQSPPVSQPYSTHRMILLFKNGPLFYAEYNIRLFFLLLFSKADIFLSNDLDSLPANFLASRIKNKPIVYDSHELFTEVPELIDRPTIQRIWLEIEKAILPRINYSYTVCQSLADYYQQKYGLLMRVVRNIPNCKGQVQPEPDSKRENVVLYQGSVNVGRGVDLVIKAMKFLEGVEFWVIGSGDVENEMKALAHSEGVADKVKFFGRIPFADLRQYTRQAMVGISLEENRGLNYYYALPNKLFDYIHAGVPILGSDLPEISRIIDSYQVGIVAKSREPEYIAREIRMMLSDQEMRSRWDDNLKEAAHGLCWENEEKELMALFDSIHV
ncbi:MAG: glycosyltransferase [Bacteroidales bacterium]|nr:glycosyltransferase [Bacteroidales bacterium]MCF8456356.1 glycosyltransferase [Bacteroidales bacterium]